MNALSNKKNRIKIALTKEKLFRSEFGQNRNLRRSELHAVAILSSQIWTETLLCNLPSPLAMAGCRGKPFLSYHWKPHFFNVVYKLFLLFLHLEWKP